MKKPNIMNNKFGTITIEMSPSIVHFCPLGKQWSKTELTARLVLGEKLMDYMDVDEWLRQNIDGHSMIIEEVVTSFFEYLDKEYTPMSLMVEGRAERGKHFPVVVRKTKEGKGT